MQSKAQRVQIGPLTYTVVLVEELASASGTLCGDIDPSKCRIRINADDDPQAQHITLWHEILHGILYSAGLRDHNEQIVDALAHGVAQVLRDNPGLTVAQGAPPDPKED